jgi:hypothetical protein
MTRRDRVALKAAMRMARQDKMRAQQLDAKLADGEPWEEVAAFAAYCCQRESLRLRPWECPPLHSADEIDARERYGGTAKEVALRRRMIALGISLYEPNPLAAITAAEAEAKIDPSLETSAR